MTEMISVQKAWEAAGGNPGIKATADELVKALKMMDQAEDDVEANYLSARDICTALGVPEMGKAELLDRLHRIRDTRMRDTLPPLAFVEKPMRPD